MAMREPAKQIKQTKLRSKVTPVLPLKREVKLNPYQCACTLVKAAKVKECPVHWLAIRLAEGRH